VQAIVKHPFLTGGFNVVECWEEHRENSSLNRSKFGAKINQKRSEDGRKQQMRRKWQKMEGRK